MKKVILFFISTFYISFTNGQITYNWQNSTEGWVSGGNCNLTAQPDAMAMRLFASNAVMRSGNLQSNLGINGGDYNQVQVMIKNPTTGSAMARLFLYPPGTNTAACYYAFQVDTAMTGFSTYTISLDSIPTGGSSTVYTGPIARFGLRAPWGGVNFDTIFWKQMIVSNTNQIIDSANITFKVDMSEVSDPFIAPELNGTFNSWCGNCNAMSDSDGDNVWDVTVSLQTGDTIEYKYSADNWSIQETNDPNGICTNGDPNFTNRVLIIPSTDTILSEVCWASCNPCSTGNPEKFYDFSISPNPATDILIINSDDLISNFIIYDLCGKVILHSNINSKYFKINLSSLKTGPYIVYTKNQKSSSYKKFLVNK